MKVQKKRHFCWRDKNHAHRFHVFYSVEIMELYYRTVWFTHLGENFVKITCFTKEVTKYKLKRCFDEIFFSVSKFFCFRHCVFVFDSFWFSKNDFQLCLLLSYCFDDPIKTISYPIFLRDFLLLRKFFFLPGFYPLIFPPLCVTFCVC